MTAVKTPYLGQGFLIQVGDGASPEVFCTIGGFRTNSLKINQSEIDVTDKDGMPWRTLILGGVRSIDASGGGVFSDDPELADIILKIIAGYKGNFKVIFANGASFVGPFLMKGVSFDGPHDKEQTYTVDLSSAGTIVYTAPLPVLTSATPATDVAAGGAAITLVGTGFQKGATVKFGVTAATGVVVVDGTHITCTAPAHSAGAAIITVTNPDGQVSVATGVICTYT